MKRQLLLAAFIVVAVLVTVVAYLLRTGEVAENCKFTLDPVQLRALANELPGDKPQDIRAERFVTFRFPRALVSTGESFDLIDMEVFAYQLVYPDKTIMIDTAMNEADSKGSLGLNYDTNAWGHLLTALKQASAIYVTHEHDDHLGGLLATGDSAVWKRAHLNLDQLAPGPRLRARVMPDASNFNSLVYDRAVALAPGLVAIKAAGHTPGSQMFFVQRADGRELLIVGDTAWQSFAIERNAIPPRLATLILMNEPFANACQVDALHHLTKADPSVHVMPGHDGAKMQALLTDGVVGQNFRL